MLTFLFEQYGYYPQKFIDNMFSIDGWKFKLIEVECDNQYVEKIDNYLYGLRECFPNEGIFIIKNRANEKVSFYDGKKYVLISIKKSIVNIEDVNRFHSLLKEEKMVNLKDVLGMWQQKMAFIENEAISSVRMDNASYGKNLEVIMYCLGMCQNAIQYLSDLVLDYDYKIEGVTITHKRLCSLDSFEVFNPFNFVADHPVRDIIELYKNDVVDFETVKYILGFYAVDSKIATWAFCRLLYPSQVFDKLEANYYKSDKSFKLEYNIEKEYLKVKKIYVYFRNTYIIRPIKWLEEI